MSKIKGEIERTCALCGAKFKCRYDDEMSKVFAEAWEICPKCWKKGCFVGGEENERREQISNLQ